MSRFPRRSAILAGMGAVAFAAAMVSGGQAATAASALHVFCTGSTPTCSDNGSITPTTSISPDFGFKASPDSGTAAFQFEVLIPNNVGGASSLSITINGSGTAVASATGQLVSTTAWASGQLDSYLGFSASPTNPIGAFLPLTQAFDAAATGYYAYTFSFGNVTFGSPDPTFTTSFDFPEGTVITAFAGDCSTSKCTATANSGALLIDSPVPEPSTAAVLGVGLLGLAMVLSGRRFRSRRRA